MPFGLRLPNMTYNFFDQGPSNSVVLSGSFGLNIPNMSYYFFFVPAGTPSSNLEAMFLTSSDFQATLIKTSSVATQLSAQFSSYTQFVANLTSYSSLTASMFSSTSFSADVSLVDTSVIIIGSTVRFYLKTHGVIH